MGFTNTSYKDNIKSLTDGFIKKLDNPYYMYNDKIATLVEYYNINKEKSTLDDGSKNVYSNKGENCPLKFNIIHDMYLYGLDQINIQLDNGDHGLESGDITGEAVILPNTIEPYPGDFFTINHVKNKFTFLITDVNIDTLENGSNFYKVNYELELLKDDEVKQNTVEDYTMMINNVGTSLKAIVKSNDFNFIKNMDDVLLKLCDYYKALFYSNRVETFVFSDSNNNSDFYYDAYLIEFIIRNKLMKYGSSYINIQHQAVVNSTFPIDYDKTVFRAIENRDKSNLKYLTSKGIYIDDTFSIMAYRIEEYFKIDYFYKNTNNINPLIYNFNQELMNRVQENRLYENDKEIYKNIIVKYFNKTDLLPEDIIGLDKVDFNTNADIFYQVPMLIYIIQFYVTQMLLVNT